MYFFSGKERSVFMFPNRPVQSVVLFNCVLKFLWASGSLLEVVEWIQHRLLWARDTCVSVPASALISATLSTLLSLLPWALFSTFANGKLHTITMSIRPDVGQKGLDPLTEWEAQFLLTPFPVFHVYVTLKSNLSEGFKYTAFRGLGFFCLVGCLFGWFFTTCLQWLPGHSAEVIFYFYSYLEGAFLLSIKLRVRAATVNIRETNLSSLCLLWGAGSRVTLVSVEIRVNLFWLILFIESLLIKQSERAQPTRSLGKWDPHTKGSTLGTHPGHPSPLMTWFSETAKEEKKVSEQ